MDTTAFNLPVGMPPPQPTALDAGMWAAAAEGRLDVQRCSDCGAHRYPPSETCYRCRSEAWLWDTLPGTGVVASYVWIPDRARPAADGAPQLYNVAVVALDGTEGDPVRIVTNVVDAWELGDLEVGQRVELTCVPVADGIGLPCFRRLNGTGAS